MDERKIRATIKKLEALAAENSGASDGERASAKNRIEALKKRLGGQANSSQNRTYSNPDIDELLEELLKGFFEGANHRDENKASYEEIQKNMQEEFDRIKQQQASQTVQDMDFRTPAQKSEVLLAGIDVREIKFYQARQGLFVISEMTLEFLDQQIEIVSSHLEDAKRLSRGNGNRYQVDSLELILHRLRLEKDIRIQRQKDGSNKTWRFTKRSSS